MEINVGQLFAAINVATIMPEVILSIMAMVLLLVNVFVPSKQKTYLTWLSLLGIIGAGLYAASGWGQNISSFSGSVVLDNFAIFFKLIFLVSAGLAVLISDQYMERENCNHGELYP